MALNGEYEQEKPRFIYTEQMTQDGLGLMVNAMMDIQAKANAMVGKNSTQIVGTGAANGTEILTFNITANKKLAVMSCTCNFNVRGEVRIGTGALGAMTDYFTIKCASATGGFLGFINDECPGFIISNITGAGGVALAVRMYAPQTADGIGLNNDGTHYWSGNLYGIEF